MRLAFGGGIVNEFVNSSLVIDKFCVIKHFDDVVNQTLRVDIVAGYVFVKSTIWVKNCENLTEKQLECVMCVNWVYFKMGWVYRMEVMVQEICKLAVRGDVVGACDKLFSWMSGQEMSI
jgi:hypothetical protein